MKNKYPTAIRDLHEQDLASHELWSYAPSATAEILVRPSKGSNGSLSNKLVSTKVRFSNGQVVRALIGNLDCSNFQLNEHFLTLSILFNGNWFHLARYHDPDCQEHGPEELAKFVGKRVDEVFPIDYDLGPSLCHNGVSISGRIFDVPKSPLTREEIIRLAVP